MKLNFKSVAAFEAEVVVFLVSSSKKMPDALMAMDANGVVSKAMSIEKSFTGGSGEILTVLAPYGFKHSRVILLGLGAVDQMTRNTLNSAGGSLAAYLNKIKVDSADVVIEIAEEVGNNLAVDLATGIKLRNYAFNKHFVSKKSEHLLSLSQVNFLSSNHSCIQEAFKKEEAIVDGVLLTRDLVAETPNNLFPSSFALECQKLEKEGLTVRVLGLKEIEDLKMNALLGVAQGSAFEPRVVVMEWRGDEAKQEMQLALVGKGVTFDSGGINLKPSSGISDMKYDMGGAGVVTGTMMSLARRRAKANVVGIIGIVENMPSGTAQRPSDVVVSMSGQTIEVDNTDAEGRLVLADIMWYVQEEYKAGIMIDLATLTGAISVALGDYYGGLFSNDKTLAKSLMEAGIDVSENLWQLPMHKHYDKQINSDIADVKNVGQSGRGGGSITAAQFLQRFVKEGVVWAHLDIAGVTWTKFGYDTCPKGATGFGVRLLNNYIMSCWEGVKSENDKM